MAPVPLVRQIRHIVKRFGAIFARKKLLVMIVSVLLTLSLFTAVPFLPHLGLSQPNVVIVLGANKGGGVLQWKGAQEWETERLSIENKKDYVARHGYSLAVKDMKAKKRYTHEWRESWEKVDLMKEAMRQFPKAEWFWWLDLETWIMEPKLSLEKHVFEKIPTFDRNLTYFNPAGLELEIPFVDYSQPVDMILTQDCGGFTLGSFMLRRSEWTNLLLDVWWDPVFYEQKHMEWVHGEQTALEYLYNNQAWIRSRVAFAPLRQINAYVAGACADFAGDQRFFYNRNARDFLVNMAGCQWGRDCWKEMQDYKDISQKQLRKRFFFF